VIGLLKKLFGRPGDTDARSATPDAPMSVPALDLPEPFWRAETRLPIPDWNAVATLEPADAPVEQLDAFWRRAATSWLTRLAHELGGAYRVALSDHFALLASRSARECQVTLDFAERVRRRILRTLPGVAVSDGHGPTAVLLFDDPDDYYAYIDHYYPSEGVFAMSSGMFVDAGYGHFVFMADDVSQMEPVLVHELTHALLRHLNLPRWLDEGAAVNMEMYLVPHMADPRRNLYAAHEMAAKHAAFWNEHTIQEFWTGHSFLRPDDGNLLSYDLAERMSRLLSAQDYARYAALLQGARADDGGIGALRDAFGLDPGDVAAEVLGAGPWQAQPSTWERVEAQAVSQSQMLAQAMAQQTEETASIPS